MTVRFAKRRKYGNKPTYVDGLRFDSGLEANRWRQLKLLERAGQIKDLERQVWMPLKVVDRWGTESTISHLVLDFTYYENGEFVAEDFKGFETRDWKLKQKHFEAQYMTPIRVTRAR